MRSSLTVADLHRLAAATFPGRTLADVIRLTGGTNKGVYRLTFDDEFTCLAYRWHPDENFWPAAIAIDVGPFRGEPGLATFVEKHALLSGLGVRVPAIAGDEPVLIDIEGTMVFDVEWEHAFLELRFGPQYPRWSPCHWTRSGWSCAA